MAEVQERARHESVQNDLEEVIRLLDKGELEEGLVHKQEGPKQDLVDALTHKQAHHAAAEEA